MEMYEIMTQYLKQYCPQMTRHFCQTQKMVYREHYTLCTTLQKERNENIFTKTQNNGIYMTGYNQKKIVIHNIMWEKVNTFTYLGRKIS
jgi:endo-alpha-1,4-polygalactosaminidase (GH114 family)